MFKLQNLITVSILVYSVYCQNCVRDPNNTSMCTFNGIQRSKEMDNLTDPNPDEIESINIVNSFVNRIPITLTEVYTNLTELDISNCLVCVLRNTHFTNSSNLQKLNVSGNIISYLESNINDVLQNLEILDLSRNRIQFMEDNVLYNFTNLKYLNLSHNEIRKLPANFTTNTNNVNILDISNNKVSSLDGDFSSTISSSKEVNLSNNLLATLNPMSFKNLLLLNINFNKLKGAINFSGTNLKELHIRGNYLQSLTINKKLIKLDVSDNFGNSFEIDFGSESSLKYLVLSNLKLLDYTCILDNISRLNHLESLDLSMSNLTTFDFDKHQLPRSLTFLSLERTQLTILKNFKNMPIATPNLREIIFYGNFLSDNSLLDITENFKQSGINVTGLELAAEIKIDDKNHFNVFFSENKIIIITTVFMNILLFVVNFLLLILLSRRNV